MSPLFNDTDDDVTLQSRRSAAEDQGYGQRRGAEVHDEKPIDREVTLNTGIVLVLFFALALLCAVFFGFGYSMGRKSVPTPIAVEPDTSIPAVSSAGGTKPAPGSPASTPVPDYVPSSAATAERTSAPVLRAVPPPAGAVTSTAPKAVPGADNTTVAKPAPVLRVPPAVAVPSAVPTAPPTASAAAGSSYVQIAAVSHQEDADVLLSALRRRGYAVLTRSDAADHLIHVQVGPFGSRKEADAMRLKLAGDGYNAIIK